MGKTLWQTFNLEQIKQMVSESDSFAELTRKMGYKKVNGYANKQLKQYFEENNIDYSHFKGMAWRAGGGYLDDCGKNDFGVVTPAIIKKHLLMERGDTCESCGNNEWLGKKLPLQVHHIDGDRSNNLKNNLLLLCPNCHSITDNWCTKNEKRVSKEQIIEAAKISKSYCEICSRVGWAANASHYAKIKEVLGE